MGDAKNETEMCAIRDVSIAWRYGGYTAGGGVCRGSAALLEHRRPAAMLLGTRRPMLRHQMIARARRESDGYSRASRSMGVSISVTVSSSG